MGRRLLRVRAAAVLVVALTGAAGCSSVGDDAAEVTVTNQAPAPSGAETTTTAVAESSEQTATTAGATTVPPTTTSTIAVPPLDEDRPVGALVTPTGVVVPVTGGEAGAWQVETPCGVAATVTGGEPVRAAHVVLDPGHGGDELGAVGPTGLEEKQVNLEVSEAAARQLRDLGFSVVLTRTTDLRMTLATRAEIANRLDAGVFISVHHNAEPDEAWPGPGSETYYQIASEDSKRLAGLLWEELVAALEPFDVAWSADTDAGAKYRLASSGGDYYGVLRRTAGVPAVLSEALFVSQPEEEALLRRPEAIEAEAQAITDTVVRFFTTDDPGTGFTEPYPRTTPAGPGGGASGCTDPPLE
ncbi:MAG: N-acetylmuramoyl-L-alanine amidase [Actinomycetota bacterium]|nr:N-acetylmuramoyl-L-alanine amidase [Actinomycetota bacterium]